MNVRPEVADKSLRLVASFEGHSDGRPAGNFDGQVLTWGYLGWNLGQGTLLPVLLDIVSADPESASLVMSPEFVEAVRAGNDALIQFVKSFVLDERGDVKKDWVWRFRVLYGKKAASEAMRKASDRYLRRAERIATRYQIMSERAFALSLDIAVQNGSVLPRAHRMFMDGPYGSPEKPEGIRLVALAEAVAEAAIPRWKADVLSRKRTIATGSGVVHGRRYQIETDFGISLTRPWRGVG